MDFLALFIGLGIGFLLAWLYFRSKKDTSGSAAFQELQTKNALLADRAQTLEREKATLTAQLDASRNEARSLSADLASAEATLHAEKENHEKRVETLQSANVDVNNRLDKTRVDVTSLTNELGETKATLRAVKEQYEEMQRDKERNTKEFENLANRILDEKSEKFTKLNESNLENILSPLKLKLTDFEKKVDDVYRAESQERSSLRGQIISLVELNQQISQDAKNLTSALKGDAKKQGNWGEVILDRVLEVSGLRKGEEYKTQESFVSHDGARYRPDAVIYLPENKHLVIDAKVSLVAYERIISAETEEDRKSALLEHIGSVKSHIKGLSDKNYPALEGLDAPDFTLLFMPIESSFGLAIQADNELFNFAWERKIIVVSPSTLLATLRTISSIWKQERQTRNAVEIADQAGKMYDKFVGFVEDLISVGKKMDDTKKSYADAMTKLSSGTGNLVRRSEQLKDLGAKASKQLPMSLLDRTE